MKAFIDTGSLSVLALGETATSFGGPWGALQEKGLALWVDVPAGELVEDCDVQAGPPVAIVLNATRKAARLAKQNKAANLASNLANDDVTAIFPALTAPQQAFLNRLRRAAVLAMKSVSSED